MESELPSLKVVGFLFFFFVFTSPVFAANPVGDSTALHPEFSSINLFLRSQIVSEAKQYLGLTYRYGGTKPETGFDCSGFTSYVMRSFALMLPHSSRSQAQEGREIDLRSAKAGDIIAFRRSRNRHISHVAMVVENTEAGVFIIHSTSRGVVIDNLSESRYWRPKVCAVRDVLSNALPSVVFPEPIRMQAIALLAAEHQVPGEMLAFYSRPFWL